MPELVTEKPEIAQLRIMDDTFFWQIVHLVMVISHNDSAFC